MKNGKSYVYATSTSLPDEGKAKVKDWVSMADGVEQKDPKKWAAAKSRSVKARWVASTLPCYATATQALQRQWW